MSTVNSLFRTGVLLLLAPLALAAGRDFDPEQLALTYHKLAGKPFDFDRYAASSASSRGPRASIGPTC